MEVAAASNDIMKVSIGKLDESIEKTEKRAALLFIEVQ